jgi:hypothetical protein
MAELGKALTRGMSLTDKATYHSRWTTSDSSVLKLAHARAAETSWDSLVFSAEYCSVRSSTNAKNEEGPASVPHDVVSILKVSASKQDQTLSFVLPTYFRSEAFRGKCQATYIIEERLCSSAITQEQMGSTIDVR